MSKFIHPNKKIRTAGDLLGWGVNPEPDAIWFDNCITAQDIKDNIEKDVFRLSIEEIAKHVHEDVVEQMDPFWGDSEPLFPQWIDLDPTSECQVIVGPDSPDDAVVLLAFVESWAHHYGGELLWFSEGEVSMVLSTYPGRTIISKGPTPIKISKPTTDAKQTLKYFTYRLKG